MGRTNIVLDEELVEQARQLTGLKTIREIVHEGLRALVAREQRKGILTLRGRVEWRGDLSKWRDDR